MLGDACFIAWHTRHLLRERETMLWLFVMPIVFFYFIGTITSGFGPRPATKPRLVVRVGENAGFLAEELIRRLEAENYEVVKAGTLEEFDASWRRLEIPADFSAKALANEKATIRFARKEGGLNQRYDDLRIRRAVYTVLADLVAVSATGEEPNSERFRQLDDLPRTLKIQVEPGGKRKHVPNGFEQAIPGTLVMFTLIVLLTSGTVTVVNDRKIGALRRLASTPISRETIIFGKWLGRLFLALVQIVFAMIAGSLLFGMKWGADLPMILLVLLAWGGFCASLALLLGNLIDSEAQGIGIGVLASNLLAALGGCWWPIEITPPWMQGLSHFLPSGWAMDAMHRLISFQAGWAAAIPHVLALLTASVVIGYLAARRFRFQ
jgi:ABC-type Na+ efflux pump permease subunit